MTPKYRSYQHEAIQCTTDTTPPPRILGHRYATEVDFEIYDMGPLSPLHSRCLFYSQSAPDDGHGKLVFICIYKTLSGLIRDKDTVLIKKI